METKAKKPIYKKWWFWVIIAVVVIGSIGNALDDPEDTSAESAGQVASVGKDKSDAILDEETDDKTRESIASNDQENEEASDSEEKAQDEEVEFQSKCEKNAEQHPAKPGAILYTKGDNNFTGMEYYFVGEIIKFDTIENNVGDPSVWLVKNEKGYVMPIQHEHFKAEIGDAVEVWGTLSGNGYANADDIDNVVGQTGSMHAIMVTVNGEMQY